MEEDSSMSEPTNIKIVLPNKPHSSALQVEEIGSYSYATHEESVSYKSTDSGDKLSQGIVDDLFSDDDITMSRKHCASRGISIMSASEDEGSLQGEMLSREMSIDERAIDDGLTKIRMSRTVLEETEVSFVEVDENGVEKPFVQSLGGDKKKQKGKFFIAETVEEENVPEGSKPDVETVTLKPKKGKQLIKEEVDEESTGFDFNEKTSKNKDLSEENLNLKQKGKAFEIKKAEDEEAKLQMKIQEEDNSDSTPKTGKLLEVSEKLEKSEEISEISHIEKKKNDEGRKKSIKVEEDEGDDDIDRLIKRIQKQRSVLDGILENKQETKDDESSKKQKGESGEKQKKVTEVFDEKAKSILEDENSYKNKKHQSVLDDTDGDEETDDDESDKEEGINKTLNIYLKKIT